MKKIFVFFTLTMLVGSAFAASDVKPAQQGSKTTFTDDARQYREEGYRLQSAGRIDEAYSMYTKALAMDPGYVDLYNDLGVVFELRGDLDSAEGMYLKAVEIDPALSSSYTNLGFLYEKKRDKERAGFYWRKRFEMGSDNDRWKEIARQHLVELGTWDEMQKKIKEDEALKLSQTVAFKREQLRLKKNEEGMLHYKIGIDLYSRADYETAVREFNTAMQLKEDGATVPADVEKYFKDSVANAMLARVKVKLDKSQALASEKDYLSLMNELRESLDLLSEIPADRLMNGGKSSLPTVNDKTSKKKSAKK